MHGQKIAEQGCLNNPICDSGYVIMVTRSENTNVVKWANSLERLAGACLSTIK